MRVRKNIVLYHNPCGDGFGAAWAAWKKFGDRARYIGVNHGDPLPASIGGSDIYILDFSFPPEVMKKILATARHVVALDHHISAKHSTYMASNYMYDLKHSGAVITWRYFHPKKPVPSILRHIEDIDLWKFALPKTREIVAHINSYPFSFKRWSAFARDLERGKSRKKIIESGAAIVRYEEETVRRALGRAQEVRFLGKRVLAVNATSLVSEIGNVLVKRKGPFAIVWSEKNGNIVVSLRSNTSMDVSRIAARFGGGGHKRAAGFSFAARNSFPWKPIRK